MELKEARYILAIARHQSIGKAAESLYISQPSLSKYLKNLEERLGAPLFSRHENRYYPTYMGERYLHYAEQIVACGDEWMQEYDDIAHRQRGRLNIAVPIMMGSTLIEPMLAPFHKRYPYVRTVFIIIVYPEIFSARAVISSALYPAPSASASAESFLGDIVTSAPTARKSLAQAFATLP